MTWATMRTRIVCRVESNDKMADLGCGVLVFVFVKRRGGDRNDRLDMLDLGKGMSSSKDM